MIGIPVFLTNVNKKYSNYIPLSIGERVVHQATPNGNCIYNAASTILLKLSSVVKIVDDLVPFSKYIVEEFRENTFLWVHSATRGGSIVGRNTAEIEHLCRIELLETVKHPYTDGSLFHF